MAQKILKLMTITTLKRMTNTKEIWEKQSFSNSTQLVIKEKIEEVSGLNCFVGTIGLSGAKVFILELGKNINIQQNYLKRFVGVEIQVLPAINHSELVIILLENDLSEIFGYFIEDIINDLKTIKDQNIALVKITSKINYWKRLFSKVAGVTLTPLQQQGLYGELYFLNELLEFNTDKWYIINGWHGPLGANQDFIYNGIAIEIKTSKSNSPTIKISNEHQLDKSGLTELFLILYKLNEYSGGKDTLHSLIQSIRQKLENEALIQFNEKIQNLGIQPDVEEEYVSLSYNIVFEKLYKITDDFPKIVRNNLNNALSDVSYVIEPRLCTEFEKEVDLIFNQINNGSI